MCIRDRIQAVFEFMLAGIRHWVRHGGGAQQCNAHHVVVDVCLLYTSDAADERSSVDLGGRRIIKKKNTRAIMTGTVTTQ